MAIASTTVWELRATNDVDSLGRNMLQGGGFNPGNANFLADLACAGAGGKEANSATPEVSSASYNFVSTDVSAWLYIKSGTNWTPGWYQISSVAANKATLSAAVGTALWVDTNNLETGV